MGSNRIVAQRYEIEATTIYATAFYFYYLVSMANIINYMLDYSLFMRISGTSLRISTAHGGRPLPQLAFSFECRIFCRLGYQCTLNVLGPDNKN